ncbi:Probable aspartic proteinase GIP2 [Linum perenne]
MASRITQLFLFTFLSHLAFASSKPTSLILPLSQDGATHQIRTHLHIGTPPVTRTFILDLAGQISCIHCNTGYSTSSSTRRLALCGSSACSLSSARCSGICSSATSHDCHNNTCRLLTQTPFQPTAKLSNIALDTVSLRSSIGGAKAGKHVSIPNFIFACNNFYNNLPTGVFGSISLSRSPASVPSQLSSAGTLAQKFAICLPSAPNSNGIMFFGDSPYVFYPSDNVSRSIDVSHRLIYTKLHKNYHRTHSPGVRGAEIPDYFVKITSILVNGSPIRINSTLLEFHPNGIGGTKVSTMHPYSVLESSIYRSIVRAFEKELMKTPKVKKAAAVAPFRDCYEKGDLPMTLSGIAVPEIALIFENRDVRWGIDGVNSMVDVSPNVICLGFVDGGPATVSFPTTAAVIGAYQMQGVLVQFDLGSDRLGFTNTLLAESVECSNFHF